MKFSTFKRICSLLLALMMVVPMFTTPISAAVEEAATISIGSASAEVGETVTVTVAFHTHIGIAGMVLTPEGEEFISYAKDILKQIDQVENMYKSGQVKKQKFSISVPRACYISDAFAEFSKTLSKRVGIFFINFFPPYRELYCLQPTHLLTLL